jgi:hypothetical protein
MAYNRDLLKQGLSEIKKENFKQAIYYCYKDGITTLAPLGFSGDNILLFGEEQGGRKSVVSIRNYSGNAELLITDKKGNFLFYGRYDVNIGVDFIADQYWKIFLMVYDFIESEIEKVSEFANVKLNANCESSEGFKMLSAYQKAHKELSENK